MPPAATPESSTPRKTWPPSVLAKATMAAARSSGGIGHVLNSVCRPLAAGELLGQKIGSAHYDGLMDILAGSRTAAPARAPRPTSDALGHGTDSSRRPSVTSRLPYRRASRLRANASAPSTLTYTQR